ncbi:T-cell surface glycoprotein CD3 zeta chain [Clupea harengus]|uniref:T-cell surface glycoprotein CD3 zeta chain n=1 Tax=Clupea harengus TaxID=7950 RepID=A0A6P8ERH5_CLUHA|nr:T-cell surface glycoprotein CD3 zeta chain [Clupea harengus]
MAWQTTGAILLMVLVIPSAEAALDLYDPRICYVLDGFLMFYGVAITALLIREKCFRPKTPEGQDDPTYQTLGQKGDNSYGEIQRKDVESGQNRTRKQQTDDSTYSGLVNRTEDPYGKIHAQKERRRQRDDQVYQGLSTGTKDTYDSLHMQPRHKPSH